MPALTLAALSFGGVACAEVQGWANWRGPLQNGWSQETDLPDTWEVGGANHRWDVEIPGRGTPVISAGRLYALGYDGEGPDLQEVLVCLDAETGKRVWERRFNDFLSDVIYNRYAIGSPTIDVETGNVYVLTTPGIFACFTRNGNLLWRHSMMEEFGRMTFPNGRTGSPVIDDDLVIVRGITSNWGRQGPARDRFYAFDKKSGGLVWASTPGVRPRDSSFSTPVLALRKGKRVFYCGTGCGNIVCVNVRTGEPIWRYQLSIGGVNSSVVSDRLLLGAIHGRENIDSSAIGRMVALKLNIEPKPSVVGGTPILDKRAELWRNGLSMFTSSPVKDDFLIYQVTHTGVLCCVNAQTGKILWRHKLAPDQLHASPLWADGKLYIPMRNGTFFILRPSETGVEELCKVKLAGSCLGAPVVWNGKIYVHTTETLYCFGETRDSKSRYSWRKVSPVIEAGMPTALQVVPAEVLIRPRESVQFMIRGVDANGFVTGTYDPAEAAWRKFIPATAKVSSEMNADFNEYGELVAGPEQVPSAGAFEVTIGGLKGTIRGRVLPDLPLREDFEGFAATVPHRTESGMKFAYPPLPWIGARFKWEVREIDGNMVLAKTLDRVLFQRATTFIGHPDMKNYTFTADVMTEGNRRVMSTAGVINQRYVIALLGNAQRLEVSSNHERIKVSVPFEWRPKIWYRLKTRVNVAADGSGVVYAKAWKRGEQEPDVWTITIPHRTAHTNGAPGLFGFAPQSQFRVYIDNIEITQN